MNLNPAHRAVRGALSSPLDRGQKAALCILARQAFDAVRPGGEFDAWRHEQTLKACGKLSLRCATQADYAAIKAHLLSLLGHTGRAFNSALRSQTEPRRQALHKLRGECRSQGVALDYAIAIARSKFHQPDLELLSPSQIWQLVFSVRRRGQKNRSHNPPSQPAPPRRLEPLGHLKARLTNILNSHPTDIPTDEDLPF
jgi:hypothetical protein